MRRAAFRADSDQPLLTSSPRQCGSTSIVPTCDCAEVFPRVPAFPRKLIDLCDFSQPRRRDRHGR
ncbi:hypothetical protein ACFPRL_02385 [Pseudoclavibacter helvolus]